MKLLLDEDGVKHKRRKASLSDSEIMTILLYFHLAYSYRDAEYLHKKCYVTKNKNRLIIAISLQSKRFLLI